MAWLQKMKTYTAKPSEDKGKVIIKMPRTEYILSFEEAEVLRSSLCNALETVSRDDEAVRDLAGLLDNENSVRRRLIRDEVFRGCRENGRSRKQALTDALDSLSAWDIATEEVIHDGTKIAAVAIDYLPVTNFCHYCHFKGAGCEKPEGPLTCHGDSRADGLDVVFVKVRA